MPLRRPGGDGNDLEVAAVVVVQGLTQPDVGLVERWMNVTLVIGAPPVDAGAVHFNTTLVELGVARHRSPRRCRAPCGGSELATLLDAPVPAAFLASTRKW